jgi:IPT/TIG domain
MVIRFGQVLRSGLVRFLALAGLLLSFATGNASATIGFVQSNSATPQATPTTVTITYTLAQNAGDLNVVVIGWNDSTATISSVTDTTGNIYVIAAPVVVQSGTASQAIYYAKNIAAAVAGANTVTVTFASAAQHPDIRIAEYSGLDTVSPLDGSAGAQGNTATSDSGPVTTTNANDLLVGGNLVQSVTTGPGAGYTSRGITGDGDILEDRTVTSTGSYNATASLDKVQLWIMQVVAFKAASAGGGNPSITSLSVTSGPVGTPVTITGTNFGNTQGTSTVTFNGTSAGTAGTWSSTSISVTVPTGATSGNVVVTVAGNASNGVNFTVGTVSTISFVQTNSATPQGNFSSVGVTYTVAQTAGNLNVIVVGWNDSTSTITGVTDTSGNAYSVAAPVVVQSGTASQAIYYAKNITGAAAGANTVTVTFSAAARHPDIRIAEYSGIDTANPLDTSAGAQGNTATSDSGPAATTNANDLLVGGNTVQSTTTAPGTGFTSRGITADGDILEDQIVSSTGSYNATATLDKVQQWIMQFAAFRASTGTGGSAPNISLLNPTSGLVGSSVTITGTNFGASQGSSSVTFNGTPAGTANSWSATSITVLVPSGATSGSVVVTVGGVPSNSVNFTVPVPPSITTLNPPSGPIGSAVTITGTNFGSSQGTSTVTFNGISAGSASTWNATTITVLVPAGATTGPVIVTVGSLSSPGSNFTVTTGTTTPIKLVQHAGKDAGTTTSSPLAFASNNTAGNWIVVAIRAGHSGQIFTVTDSRGNTYKQAIQFNVTVDTPNGDTLGVFYAENIAGGANTVTVSDSINGNTMRFAISEYSGVATASSLDGTAVAQGVSTAANSGPATTTASGDLLFGAFLTSDPAIFTAGTGYTARDAVPASPNTKLMTEDQVQSAAGTASATASLSVSDKWGAGLAAFKAAIGAGGTGPAITTLNPTSATVGSSVTINGSNFGSTQGSSTVTFNGTPAGTATTWTATSISIPVPTGATTGNVIVTVGGVPSNGVTFTVTSSAPAISTLSMPQGPVGSTVTITGTNFGATQGTSAVTFNGTPAGTATNWSATSIDVQVPAGATTGNVIVTVGGITSNGVPFSVVPPPLINNINPTSGPVGAVVTINGANFGPTIGTRTSTVSFNGIVARTNSWADSQILVPVPIGATSGPVVVNISGVVSNSVNFTVSTGPNINSISPTSGPVGTSVTINGVNFGGTQSTSSVTFNNTTANPTNWSDTSITVPVPSAATSGNVVVTVGGLASNGVGFTVTTTSSPIKLVQHAGKDAGMINSSTLAFPSNNSAGNFIAVVVRAGKSGQTINVSDSHSNVYKQAKLFNMTLDGETLAIFYAENIAGGANTVTVSDNLSPAGTLRFAILEYSGVALTNSLDNATATEGTGTNPNSGNLVTAWGGDLLLGEITSANAANFTAGSGYKIEDFVPAEPNTKLITEDQIQTVAGNSAATASLGSSDSWGVVFAAFKSGTGTAPQPITVAVSPTTASVPAAFGTQVFTAQLTNDTQVKGVSWSLSGAGCSGVTCGSFTNVTTSSVTYNGPASIPSPATVTLTATSIADNTKTATAIITVIQGPLAVSVSPKRGSLTTSQTQQFTATVFNDPNNAGVTWQVDGNTGGTSTSGTISTTGLFTPGTQPGVHTITATSVTNASVNSSVTFAVTDLAGVFTWHNDAARTGQNLQEYVLTPTTVASVNFTKLFSCAVDGQLYAEPLYMANLTVGSVTRNVVFLATEHDSVYAFDADSPSCVQLWRTSFLGTGVTTMSWQDTANPNVSGANATDDVFPEIGITSTPVIDPSTKTIYVVAKTKETVGSGCSTNNPCYVIRLHALDVTTGAEKLGGPVALSFSNFVPQRHFNRPALLLSSNTIYVALGSHGDIPPWYGWVFAYDAGTLARKWVFSTSDPTGPGTNGDSIWGGGAGPAADASGNIYVTTGNGAYDGVKNFSETVLKISSAGVRQDWFTPFNRSTFDANDIDMGSSGVMILPDTVASTTHPHLALATGKPAILYLLDQGNMGTFNSTTNRDVQEVIPIPPQNTTQLDNGNFGLPAFWNGFIYTTGVGYPISQFSIANGTMSTPAFSVSSNVFPPRGATPAISASGNTNGVVWILDLTAWPSNGTAILDAYDATDVSKMLFSSPAGGTGAAGAAVKFTVPTVANGKVYVGGQASFTVFGLLPN